VADLQGPHLVRWGGQPGRRGSHLRLGVRACGLRDDGHAAAVPADTAVVRRRVQHVLTGRVPTSQGRVGVKRWSFGLLPEGV
jgi:hypothetical protein